MNDIKAVHEAAVVGDVEPIKEQEFRQPIYTSKDINGISAFHKAVANGHKAVAEHLMEKTDRAVLEVTDAHGRQAIHYAAARADTNGAKDMYDWLIEFGADEHKQDELLNSPSHYLTHGNTIKLSLCTVVPEAPRISKATEPTASGESPTKAPKAAWSSDNVKGVKDGVHIKNAHSLPPWHKITKDTVSKWIKTADLQKLEHAVYMGKGSYMKGKAAWNEEVRKFLQTVPNIANTISTFHETVENGDLEAMDRQLSTDLKLIGSRDKEGRSVLHKAAKAGNTDMVEALLNANLANAEDLVKATDKESRSAFHYAALCKDEDKRKKIEEILEKAGGIKDEKDSFGHEPSFYYENEFIVRESPNKTQEDVQDDVEAKKAGQADDVRVQEDEVKQKALPMAKVDNKGLEQKFGEAIANRNWEELVQFVLDGHGDRLHDRRCEDEEVQEFIDNIPAFQEKIGLINKALDKGSLKEIQQQLDRKKFALARDGATGVSFLHKAVVLGHMDIVRYLATNFPKALDLVDYKGRSPAHFAAAISSRDEGRAYKVIKDAGARMDVKDEKNNDPEFYAQNKNQMTLKELQDVVKLSTFEPKRTRKVSKPKDFKSQGTSNQDIQNTFDEDYETSDFEVGIEDATEDGGADPRTLQKLDISFRRLLWARQSQSLLKRFLTKKVFNRLKNRKTEAGSTLLDVIQAGVDNLEADIGLFAPDAQAYKVFWPLFKPVISAFHGLARVPERQPDSVWPEPSQVQTVKHDRIKFIQIEIRRTLTGYPLQPKMSLDHYRTLESEMVFAFEKMNDIYAGIYHSLYDVAINVRKHLIELDAIFDDATNGELKSAKVYENFPIGRGVFVAQSKDFVIWLNESDHIKIRVRRDDGDLGEAMKLARDALHHFDKDCLTDHTFVVDKEKLGYVTLSPTDLGTGLRIKARVAVKDPKAQHVQETLDHYDLRAEEVRLDDNTVTQSDQILVDVSNKCCFGITEQDIISNFILGLRVLVEK